MKNALKIYLFIFLIGIASANGLYVDNTSINIEKINDQDKIIYFNITNQETFTFYNITSDQIIDFDKFDLNSGQTRRVQATISSNSDYNGQVRIEGEYFDNLGSSNETETVTIDSEGLDICNLDLVEGDTIIWNNTLFSEVRLRNLDTQQYFATIQGKTEYQNKFIEPIEFNYQVYILGQPYSQICNLNIRPESGYIHSSIYDEIINLNLRIIYEPTNISTTFLTTSYNLSYNSQTEDIFRITNTGNNRAKNIKLEAQWFEFDENDFDLGIGESKNIGYTIRPLIYQTNDTGKNYNINIKISGNFETMQENMSVFVKYRNLDGQNGLSYDKDSLLNIVNLFCSVYPDDCPKEYIYNNETDRNVSITVNEEAYKESILKQAEFMEEVRSSMNVQNEKLASIENEQNKTSQITEQVAGVKEETAELTGTLWFGGILFMGIVAISLSLFYIMKNKSRFKAMDSYTRGEVLY